MIPMPVPPGESSSSELDAIELIGLAYVSSQLATHASDYLLMWSATQTVYRLSVALHRDGTTQVLEGVGHGTSYSGWPSADAVAQAISELRRKVAALTRPDVATR